MSRRTREQRRAAAEREAQSPWNHDVEEVMESLGKSLEPEREQTDPTPTTDAEREAWLKHVEAEEKAAKIDAARAHAERVMAERREAQWDAVRKQAQEARTLADDWERSHDAAVAAFEKAETDEEKRRIFAALQEEKVKRWEAASPEARRQILARKRRGAWDKAKDDEESTLEKVLGVIDDIVTVATIAVAAFEADDGAEDHTVANAIDERLRLTGAWEDVDWPLAFFGVKVGRFLFKRVTRENL